MSNLERIVETVENAITDQIAKRDKRLAKVDAEPEKAERHEKVIARITTRIDEMNTLLNRFIDLYKNDDETAGYADINDYGRHGRTDNGTIIYELKRMINRAS